MGETFQLTIYDEDVQEQDAWCYSISKFVLIDIGNSPHYKLSNTAVDRPWLVSYTTEDADAMEGGYEQFGSEDIWVDRFYSVQASFLQSTSPSTT